MDHIREGKYKILFLITGLRLGGAEKQLLLLATALQAEGRRVLVVAMETGGTLSDVYRDAGLELAELSITSLRTLFSGYYRFKQIVKDFEPDLIHSHMIHANYFARIFKLFNSKHKLINSAHNIREGSALLMKLYQYTNFLSNWSTNVSQEAYQHYVSHGYFRTHNSSYLPNAIEPKYFRAVRDSGTDTQRQLTPGYIYLTAGRLEPQKDHDTLIRAFSKVHQENPASRLIIAGTGSLSARLKATADQLQINDAVVFLGLRADIVDLLALCDCFVLSSRHEGFGLVVAEAMAMRKPVISTDCGGVKEVMGGFGTLVPIADVDALADAMLAEQHSYSGQAVEKARKYIERNYALPKVLAKWSELYHTII